MVIRVARTALSTGLLSYGLLGLLELHLVQGCLVMVYWGW